MNLEKIWAKHIQREKKSKQSNENNIKFASVRCPVFDAE